MTYKVVGHMPVPTHCGWCGEAKPIVAIEHFTATCEDCHRPMREAHEHMWRLILEAFARRAND